MKPRIYIFLGPDIFKDPRGCALAEDGTLLWDFLYDTPEIAIAALSGKLKQYRQHYPDGYELAIQPAEDDPGYIEARRLLAERWEAGAEARAAEHARQMEAAQARYRARRESARDDGDLAIDRWEES